ncbi:ATP-binding protein [Streptosporangium sp. NPDC006007]|uniref:ATP-binding protein n=1 Tax=Streptosporangium sp. NPDC006007 TaxID=3154575 RepID=UPI0033B65F66
MPQTTQIVDGYLPLLAGGGFPAWPLPLDGKGVEVARSAVRAVCGEFGIPSDLTYDATVITSELVTNALVHAYRTVRVRPLVGGPEIWAYLSRRAHPEIVIKVFDSAPWRGPIHHPALRPPWDAPNGRGLEVVNALTAECGGRWGVHPTRGRIGAWPTSGKAVFFTLPIPDGSGRALPVSSEPRSPRQSAERIHALLGARGLRPQLSADRGMAVICARPGVHVWIREDSLSYRLPGREVVRHPCFDEIEVVERVVRHCEEFAEVNGVVGPPPPLDVLL